MRLDKITILLGALCLVCGLAIGGELLFGPHLSGLAAILPGNGAAGQPAAEDEESGPPGGNDQDAWTATDCLDWPDAGDPRADPAKLGRHRDELVDKVRDEPGYGSQFVDNCTRIATMQGDQAVADQILYAVARFQDVLDRQDDMKETLGRIAPRYPAASYLLGTALTRVSPGEPGSPGFMRALELFRDADHGGDRRAHAPLLEMAQQLYPLSEFNLPTMLAAIQSGRFEMIPDSVATRMAVYGMWEGYRERCKAWEIIRYQPEDDAAVKNFIMPVQIERILNLVQQLPEMTGRVRQWLDQAGTLTLPDVIRDFNTAKAYPMQLLYVINVAGARDGTHAYDRFTCSGPRAERLQTNILRLFHERSQITAVPPSQPSDLDRLATTPDVLTLI